MVRRGVAGGLRVGRRRGVPCGVARRLLFCFTLAVSYALGIEPGHVTYVDLLYRFGCGFGYPFGHYLIVALISQSGGACERFDRGKVRNGGALDSYGACGQVERGAARYSVYINSVIHYGIAFDFARYIGRYRAKSGVQIGHCCYRDLVAPTWFA